MIVQKSFLNKLKDFGLNSYESKLWTALLSRGISTAGELSDIANVPRSRSYDVLESLEKKGFIIMKLGKPIKYIAVTPSEVVERVKKKLIEDTRQKTEIMDELKNTGVLEELNLLHNQGVDIVEPTELSGSFKGRDSLYSHMDSRIKSAEKSIVIMTSEQGLVRKSESLKNAIKKAKENGVKIRIAAPLTKENTKAAKTLSKFAEIKNTPEQSRFCVIDGKEVVFTLVDDKKTHPSYDSGVWVNTPVFASTLQNLFNSHWKELK